MVRYKDFRIGDIFDVRHVQKLKLSGKAYVMDKDVISDDGTNPYITAISCNNGIAGYSHYEPNNEGDCITLSTTADSSNTVFYQEKPFIGRQQIASIRRKNNEIMGVHVGLYVASLIRNITRRFNYANKLTIECLRDSKIMLPVTAVMVPDWAILETFLKVHGGGHRYE